MAKKILYNEEARKALKNGIDAVANVVKITIGPRGRNVVLDKGYGSPTITNDGVSIAKDITLKDKFENLGAEIVRVKNVTEDNKSDFRLKYMPGHPAADADGYVKMPNVNSLVETMDMREATRSYEANMGMFTQSRDMMNRTIDLLR